MYGGLEVLQRDAQITAYAIGFTDDMVRAMMPFKMQPSNSQRADSPIKSLASFQFDFGHLHVGDIIDAQDNQQKWFEAVVRFACPSYLCVHFIGWTARWDVQIDVNDSHRVAQRGTHTNGAHKTRVRKMCRCACADVRRCYPALELSTSPAPPSVPTMGMPRHQPPTPTFTHTHSTPAYNTGNMPNVGNLSMKTGLPARSNGFGANVFNGPPNFQSKPPSFQSSMPMPNFGHQQPQQHNGHHNAMRSAMSGDPIAAMAGSPFLSGDPSLSGDQFVHDVNKSEKRIIQHLHQRGYHENHPDYLRYLGKAKELAIQKANKEHQKKLQQKAEQAASRGVSRDEYAQYLRYRQEKQRQHVVQEQQRKLRMAQEQQARQRAQAAATAASATTGTTKGSAQQGVGVGAAGKLTTPSKAGGSVKGLIVLRGLPGSGKTTLAKKLAQRSKNARICTEDRYHWSGKEDGVGEYKFQPQLVFLAREWCTKEIRECITQNVNLIILDNHNARISMYEDHIQYAVDHGYRFRIIEFVATASLIDKYRNRSYKKFPREVYVKLLKLWEHDPRTELINPTFGAATTPATTTPAVTNGGAVKKEENVQNEQAEKPTAVVQGQVQGQAKAEEPNEGGDG